MSDLCNIAFTSDKIVKTDLIPISADDECCRPNHTWGPGVRTYYLVHYVVSGKGTFYCGTNKYSLSAGDMFFIFPQTIVKYQADKDDPWHYTWVNFTGDEVLKYLSLANITSQNPTIQYHDSEKIIKVMRGMPKGRTDNVAENLRFSSLMYEFMSLILKSITGREENEPTYFSQAARFIKNHFCDSITVENVSSYVGINRKYLHVLFKSACGKSPKEYLIAYRMEKACEYLLNPTLPINNIAYSVGYTDPLMFSKMFKEKIGISPSEYRKNKLNG